MTKILIIDDERPICETLEMLLREKGYDVITSESGEAGLKLIQQDQPDIVILDLRLPGIDGIEVLRTIKKLSRKSKVILTTAYHDKELFARAESLGACGYIFKPTDVAEVEVAIDKAVRGQRIGRQDKTGVVKTRQK